MFGVVYWEYMVKGQKTKKQKERLANRRKQANMFDTPRTTMEIEDIYVYPVGLVKKDLLKSIIYAVIIFIILAVLKLYLK